MDAFPEQGSASDARLATFAQMLRASPHNLLSPRGLQELEERHFPESVRFSDGLPSGPRLLDVGSGGGLPGIVIAIRRPDLEVHLLEATRKKADFLREVGEALGLTVKVHHGRAEELATGSLGGSFDLVTARAVAPLARLVPWTVPYLRPGGQLHAIKGAQWREELEAASSELSRRRLVVVSMPNEPSAAPEADQGPEPKVVVIERDQKPIG